eukprot:CAMPEP_0170923702 /NCGR_PEP_ID=MMETSP0735-20130129/11201_1 /TAXON_ID=186038 /ORGANISM="Fragilariopsis kerguelensis, Strain L26-C5" /LENGTH=379 /DNA_ID=CAMNT_0011323353 /DNA_START=77 /DNA_END=1217 /DNA_ORIENTATION=+
MDIQVFIILQLVVVLVFSLLLFCPDGSFAQTTTTTTTTSDEITPILESTTSVSSVPPTCAKLVEEENFYFPNDCVTKCKQQDGGGGFDIDRSRNVNGNMKCYCVGATTPICTDTPSCADLSIYPGSVYENCVQNVCVGQGSTDVGGGGCGGGVVVTDDIEFANSPEAANKNQTHFKVSCSCDNGTTQHCGIDSILFSDLTYLPSCTAASDTTEGKMNTLNIQSQNDCTLYCTTGSTTTTAPQQNTNNNHGAFVGGVYEEITSSTNDNDNANNKPSSSSSSAAPLLYSCSCFSDSNWNTSIATSSTTATTAVACDDTKANYNDGSGLGTTNCYEQVGVNTDSDCPPKDTDPAAATGAGIDGRMVSTTIGTASVAMILLMV